MTSIPISGPRSAWPGFVSWLVLFAATLGLFWDTGAAMVGIWARSDTFTHAFLVPPIVLWLVWGRRAALAATPMRPAPWVLVPMALVCLFWLVSESVMVNAGSQFALVGLIVLSVPAVLGWGVGRVLFFPLGFLFFAVPFGEFMLPTLIDWTADFTVAALRLTGVPVLREGNDFVIPTGSWSVVQECSGVRYLTASVMVGSLFAYLNYRTARRRLAFVGVAIIVPIVANWLRAYMIVMLGHLSGNKIAVGVDHLLYGWVFFGVVIGLMFWIGSYWSQAPAPDPEAPGAEGHPTGASPARFWAAAAMAAILMGGTQAVDARLSQEDSSRTLALAFPDLGAAADGPDAQWFVPGWRHPNAQASLALMQDGAPVRLWVGYYRQQNEERKLASSTNLVVANDDESWSEVANGSRDVAYGGGLLSVRTHEIRSAQPLGGASARRLRVWQLYWVGGHFTASGAKAKLLQAANRLRGRGDDGAVLLWATPLDAGADARLTAALQAQLAGLGARLAAVQAGP